jgi:hypothetical protein
VSNSAASLPGLLPLSGKINGIADRPNHGVSNNMVRALNVMAVLLAKTLERMEMDRERRNNIFSEMKKRLSAGTEYAANGTATPVVSVGVRENLPIWCDEGPAKNSNTWLLTRRMIAMWRFGHELQNHGGCCSD